MTATCRHIRRPDPSPRGDSWHIECDCGWQTSIPIHAGRRMLTAEQLRDRGESAFICHIPPRERKTYLLVDSRTPPGFRAADEIMDESADDGQPITRDRALAIFHEQPPIMGVFVMPWGKPVILVSTDERGGIRYGRFKQSPNGPEDELPIGEVRTHDGRVFRIE